MTRHNALKILLAGAVLVIGGTAIAAAQDTLKIAVGQRGAWDTSVTDVGLRAGIFKKHNISIETVYTQGSGETQQAVISGSADVGIGVGVMGAISAFAKGAPVRILGAETTGAGDLYWYVKADSPIKTLKDADGKTIAYSTKGSSTDGVVTALIKQFNLKAKPTATGGPPATLTLVMAGSIDVGWAIPPFGFDQIDNKQIRIIATGNDSVFKGQTVRLVEVNANSLATKKATLDRYMKAYRETVDFMYSDPKALEIYAEFAKISAAKAKRSRDDFFAKSALDPDKVVGLDVIMQDAVNLKFTKAPLTKEQIAELIQIPPR